jgi:transcriptional regulator with XRE-family HTH domain
MPKSLRSKRHRALTSVLRATRIEHGLTQRELSARLKRAPNYIAKIETGERRLDTVEFFDVADALGVDPVVLFTRVATW